MRILIKSAPTMGGRPPRGAELRVYAVDEDGKRTPIRGVERVRFACDGRNATCIATIEVAAEVDVEAMLPEVDGVPQQVGAEDTTAVGKPPRVCGPDGHVFNAGAREGDPCRCGRYRTTASPRGMVPA